MGRIPSVFLLFLLSACGGFNSNSVKDICETYPDMCSDLNPDGWCRAEKADIIKHRYQMSVSPTDKLRYDLLLDFEDYKKCISKASQIEHIKLKEKKSERIRGLLTAERELKRLANETRDATTPHLLYYQWSRFHSEQALQGFLQYEKNNQLEYPEMQVALATYYSKFDRPKTIRLLYHALELYKEDEEIDREIFRSLSSLFMKEEQFDWAYLWGYVAREFGVEDLNLTSIQAILHEQGKKTAPIEDKAAHYIELIEEGRFIAPL
ncbi:DUF2989 domain-containing protein [Bowmanella dokdonensis]|uniref:DUF2989 domain-containing protein n=1 Tax=Bowmanella dokdonensis TaxID=751969 RepID=A0A939DQP4_9ALTE|nr:DUF2989 domain-containing protein [Bowmanella dokdonensis]MBN7826913.1 DUF2989 domain-containing protein [Bowmanella dokdonensis]